MDPKKRLTVLKTIHQYLNDEPSTISVFGLQQVYAMNNRIDYTRSNYIPYMYYLSNIKTR